MTKKKTEGLSINSAAPLSSMRVPRDPLAPWVCDLCREPGKLGAWRECDVRDKPLPGSGRLVFIGSDHRACQSLLKKHPRLYVEETWDPGCFPNLCGPCLNRRPGGKCSHQDLKENGGKGLMVDLTDPLRGAIVCIRGGGRVRITRRALSCAGFKDARLLPKSEEEPGEGGS